MVVKNVKTLGIAEKFYIYTALYIYIYIYIYYLFNLLIFLLNNVHYTIVYWVTILLYSLCLIVSNVSGSVAMATRNHSTNGAHTRREHIKRALEIGLRTRRQLISVSPRYIFCWNMYRLRVGLACLFSHCYTGFKTWGESGIFSSTILEKLGVLLEFERYAVCYIF